MRRTQTSWCLLAASLTVRATSTLAEEQAKRTISVHNLVARVNQ